MLTPNDKNDIFAIAYCLAVASDKHEIMIHGYVVMSNHVHFVVTDLYGNVARFTEDVFRNLAKYFNIKFRKFENFWNTSGPGYTELLDNNAVLDAIAYTICNPVKAGLVQKHNIWPGLISKTKHYTGAGLKAKRPSRYFAKKGNKNKVTEPKMPESSVLILSVPPGFAHLTKEEFQALIEEKVTEFETAHNEEYAKANKHYKGAKAVRKQNPYDSPMTEDKHWRIIPRFKTKNGSLLSEATKIYAQFVKDYRDALHAYRKKDYEVEFPYGTYALRVRLKVCVGCVNENHLSNFT